MLQDIATQLPYVATAPAAPRPAYLLAALAKFVRLESVSPIQLTSRPITSLVQVITNANLAIVSTRQSKVIRFANLVLLIQPH